MSASSPRSRSLLCARGAYVAAAVATSAAGLLVHWRGEPFGASARDILGDILWAAMMAWWVGALAPNALRVSRSVVALALCFAVEFSQLYHQPALDAFRQTRVGHVLLGVGFDPRDLAAYAVGVATALLIELAVASARKSR